MKYLLSSFLFLLCSTGYPVQAQESIRILCSTPADTGTAFMQGFLHGNAAAVDSERTAQLRPAFWRVGAYSLAGSAYEDVIRFHPQVTVNINDIYMILHNISSQTQSQPWADNWYTWDTTVAWLAQRVQQTQAQVAYWDVWGEPDNFWTGTYGQWLETYRHTDSVLQVHLPGARIIGPELGFATCNFQAHAILQFADSLYARGVVLAGLSWHEFCQPDQVPAHVQAVRDSLALRPWLGQPDILIPEYAGPANSTIPGWNVGWLYYFETTQVDWVSHACWDETDGLQSWSNCAHGLNGLFMRDNQTPQPNYWVHRAYAALGENRVVTQPQQPRTVALASRSDAAQEIKILVGRYDNPNLGSHNAPANVTLRIRDYPYGSGLTVPVVLERIPSNDQPRSQPLLHPQAFSSTTLSFTGDSADLVIPGFVDGDAWIVYLNPADSSLLARDLPDAPAGEVLLWPNPAGDRVHIRTAAPATVQVYSLQGQCLLRNTVPAGIHALHTSPLPEGLYLVQVETAAGRTVQRLRIHRP